MEPKAPATFAGHRLRGGSQAWLLLALSHAITREKSLLTLLSGSASLMAETRPLSGDMVKLIA